MVTPHFLFLTPHFLFLPLFSWYPGSVFRNGSRTGSWVPAFPLPPVPQHMRAPTHQSTALTASLLQYLKYYIYIHQYYHCHKQLIFICGTDRYWDETDFVDSVIIWHLFWQMTICNMTIKSQRCYRHQCFCCSSFFLCNIAVINRSEVGGGYWSIHSNIYFAVSRSSNSCLAWNAIQFINLQNW